MEQVYQQFKNSLPRELTPFEPFPKAQDRLFWEGLSPEYKDYILEQGELALETVRTRGWPAILASHYLDFYRTGNRIQFEDPYFNRRALLSCLILAECTEYKGRFLDAITDGIFLLCQESGWQLPPHNNGLPLPNISQPIIDLFAGETACQLSMAAYLLGTELDHISPLVTERIKSELQQRIVIPYQNEHFWWMGEGEKPMCNWTPWITQNILASLFLTENDYCTRIAVIQKALYSMDCFVKDYGDDGCCSEGPEYYRHAGLCLSNVTQILNIVTQGLFSPIFKSIKIRCMAEYIMNMHIPGSRYYINFADASPAAGKSGAREYDFAKAVDSRPLQNFALEQWHSSSTKEKLLGLSADSRTGNNLYYLMQVLSLSAEMDSSNASVELSTRETNIPYTSIGVYIFRRGPYTLAVKAGNNADSHNHNDTGSISLYKNAEPFLIDVGVESYSAKTFSSDRYSIWTMQSAYHNLPTVNGVMQKDGAEYKATNVEYSEDSIGMELAQAYPKEALLESYHRTCTVSRDGITVEDTCRVSSSANRMPAVLSLMFCREPKLVGSGTDRQELTIAAGTLGSLRISSPVEPQVQIETIPVSDPRLRRAWPDTLYRVLIHFAQSLTLYIE